MEYGTFYLRFYGTANDIGDDAVRSIVKRYNSDGFLVYMNGDGDTVDMFLLFKEEPPKYTDKLILSGVMTGESLPYVGFTVDEDLPLAVDLDDIILYDAEDDLFYHLQPTLTGNDGEFFVAVEWL